MIRSWILRHRCPATYGITPARRQGDLKANYFLRRHFALRMVAAALAFRFVSNGGNLASLATVLLAL